MRVKMILPALTEALGDRRSIKYSLFPPLGLATLAGYLHESDQISICDEHVEDLKLDDDPELVVIQAYVTSAYRSYRIADHYRSKGAYVVMGGLHVTTLPDEAAAHADTICTGPGEDTFPAFLRDYRAGHPAKVYHSTVRTLEGAPAARRDLIKRDNYLVPNSLVVSRGCPHSCDFCYKDSFFAGGASFYTQRVDAALAQIEQLPGKHLFFLDDNLFADTRFASDLFDGMKGMGRVWQAAGTVRAVFEPDLMEKAAACGLSSLFIGFETLDAVNLRREGKFHNIDRNYNAAIGKLHDLGVMINASFVLGLDNDTETTPDATVEWAVGQGIETATFHILTPYPGTALRTRMEQEGRILTNNWDLYDTRHAVYQPAKLTTGALEEGYRRAYRQFYSWRSIARASWAHEAIPHRLRHAAYTIGWKKAEPIWDWAIRSGKLPAFKNALEGVLGHRTVRSRQSTVDSQQSLRAKG